MKISATIITLNEEKSVGRAIRSVAFCDEVVVIDSGSTDGTAEIAEKLGATVSTNPWPGYAAQKNHAAQQATHDWILSIDADEAVSAELAESIRRLKERGPACSGYDFPRLARYCGRWIRHCGWYPDRKIRLYRRDTGRWIGRHVHESVSVSGPVGHLEGDLLHFTCETLEQHRANVDRYTRLAAQEIHETGHAVGRWRLVLGPAYSFAKTYLLQRGFLDGAAGFTISRMAALYVYLKYSKARALTGG